MNFDFATILVLATLGCGVIWAIDSVAWAPKRRADGDGSEGAGHDEVDARKIAKEPIIVEYARSFFPILLAVLLLRSFLVEPFRIPSGSMLPTLHVGDFILVNKFSYGLRWPVLNSKFLDIGSPERGDVVVFRFPGDESLDYIKRVVGLPGDTVRYTGKRLTINGEPVELSMKEEQGIGRNGDPSAEYAVLTERLGEREHLIQVSRRFEPSSYSCLTNGEYTVPEGHYFVMGDNRDNSNDSRFWCGVPEENLVGKAFFIWMSWNDGIEWGRIGRRID